MKHSIETRHVADLWQEYTREKTVTTRNLLVEAYMGFANNVANRFIQQHSKIPLQRDEIQSAAYIGLIEAITHFNQQVGSCFCPYAYHRIRGAILDWLRIVSPIPRKVQDEAKKYHASRTALQQLGHKEPTAVEIATTLHILPRYIQQRECAAQHAIRRYQKIQDVIDPRMSDPDIRIELQNEVKKLIRLGTPQEKAVLTLLYLEGKTREEVAQILGKDKTRISQIKNDAIARIREYIV